MTLPPSPRVEVLPSAPDATHGLGRHIHHDPRSLRFAAPVLPKSALRSVHWARHVGIFDQTTTSACVGMAAAGWLATDHTLRTGLTHFDGIPIDTAWARDVMYHLSTVHDEFPWTFPPTDEGSSGLGAAKALQALGVISSYRHGFTAGAALTGLQSGPILLGLPWFNSMFDGSPNGRITIDVRSGAAGGHELVADQFDAAEGRVWVPQSWGATWGWSGRGWFTVADLTLLLDRDGDCTIPVPAAAPAPEVGAGCLPGLLRRLTGH